MVRLRTVSLAVSLAITPFFATAVVAGAQAVRGSASVVESYGACPHDLTRVTNDGCVYLGPGDRYVFVYDDDGPASVDYPGCIAEDGPAPCVWDSYWRGNRKAGPGIRQYVMVLD